MPLETASYIADLVPTNPAPTDGLAQADDHLRLIKSVLKGTFPNFTSAIVASTQAQLDLAGSQASGTAVSVLPAGSVTAPSLTFLGNTNCGIFSPAANQIAVTLGGTQVLLMGGSAIVTSLGIGASAVASSGAYSGGTGQLMPIGSTVIWWEDALPAEGGYVWANGTPISRTTYPILFARWGTRFGSGDGATTFGVPDLRDAIPIGRATMGGVANRALTGADTNTNTLRGEANHTLTLAELPQHRHGIGATDPGHTHSIPNDIVAGGGGPVGIGSTTTAVNAISTTVTTQSSFTGITVHDGFGNANQTAISGSGGFHNNLQPSTTANYILRAA